jgi:hypothetical protein
LTKTSCEEARKSVLRVFCRNVLDVQADALIITIDGAKKGMEGNIARAFAIK